MPRNTSKNIFINLSFQASSDAFFLPQIIYCDVLATFARYFFPKVPRDPHLKLQSSPLNTTIDFLSILILTRKYDLSRSKQTANFEK